MAAERRPTRGGSRWPSLIFGGLAVILAAVALWLALQERQGEAVPTPPPAPPGGNEFIHVVNALANQDLAVETTRHFVPIGELSVPGQGLTVDGMPLFVFVFPDAATAEAEIASADPTAVQPRSSPAGTPVATGEPYLTRQSNIGVALFGGSAEVREKVDRAIAGLP